MSGARLVGLGILGSMGVAVALSLAGSAHNVVLLAYVLFLGGLALKRVHDRLRETLPPQRRFEGLLERESQPAPPVAQLRTIQGALSAAGFSEAELHSRLGPFVREIVAVQLARIHGVDLDTQPTRARALLGDGPVWELVAPEREQIERDRRRGRSQGQLGELLDALEAI